VAGLPIALDAEERDHFLMRQFRDERVEVERVEDLARVALDVCGRELDAVALADTLALVLAVLELPQLRRGCEAFDAAARAFWRRAAFAQAYSGPRTPRRWRRSSSRRVFTCRSRFRKNSASNP
jgi:hypothetical protein